jgi:hypothetical protein
MTELDLRETLERHLDAVEVPPAPLGAVVGKGRRRHRRRRAVVGASVMAMVALVAASGTALVLRDDQGRGVDDTPQYASLGQLDFSHGARAYSSPGVELHLAGRTFPYAGFERLDTDAVATSYGVVFYDDGRPMLLGADGEVRALVQGDLDQDFRATAKVDSKHPWVAYATRRGITVTVTVHDLAANQDVASTTIDCPGCTDFAIDAFDDGVAYVRIDQLTRSWDIGTGQGKTVYDGGGRVVDVRGGVMLYDGKAPADLGLTRVKAPGDATLTFDGKYVLDWSSRLRSTDGGPDLVLDQGPTEKDQELAFWAIDSDGSVLVARADGDYPHYLVYDCEVPSGACEELGPLVTTSGDPEFIGVDE